MIIIALQRRGHLIGGWSSKVNKVGQWLQFFFGRYTTITRVLTQGRQDANQWVTSYTLAYGNDGYRFRTYKNFGRERVGTCCVITARQSPRFPSLVCLKYCTYVIYCSVRFSSDFLCNLNTSRCNFNLKFVCEITFNF